MLRRRTYWAVAGLTIIMTCRLQVEGARIELNHQTVTVTAACNIQLLDQIQRPLCQKGLCIALQVCTI